MTTEEKFHAAVNVIRSLPKDGAYQPSDDLKLRFYAYFKQATEGPCSINKPKFWDVIGRIKWNAWKNLGDMPREEAMTNYVEELKKIVETMSYNANVETFLGSLGNFHDSVPPEDIEMLLGSVIDKVRSLPGSPLQRSPLVSRDTSPKRNPTGFYEKGDESVAGTSPVSFMTPSPQPPDTEDEDEEFIDTVETSPIVVRSVIKSLNNSPVMPKRIATDPPVDETKVVKRVDRPKENGYIANGLSNGFAVNGAPKDADSETDDGAAYSSTRASRPRDKESPAATRRRAAKQNGGPKMGSGNVAEEEEQVSEPVREAVLQLQRDLERITSRVRDLEANVLSQGEIRTKTSSWPLAELSPRSAAFIVIWPVVAHLLMVYFNRKK